MKKYILLLSMCIALFSCDDFLEQKSKDKVIPSKVNHVKEMVFGELIRSDFQLMETRDLMSDDVQGKYFPEKASDDKRITNYHFFTWKKDLELDKDEKYIGDAHYKKYYKNVVTCNSAEDLLSTVEDEYGEQKRILAEVMFFRALNYFELAVMYGVPYENEASSKTTLCVPINKNEGIQKELFKRATQREVFDLIEDNIEECAKLYKEGNFRVTKYRPNFDAACVLATRIFLYQKKYDKVIEYANMVDKYGDLYNLNEYLSRHPQIENAGAMTDIQNSKLFINDDNMEILFCLASKYNTLMFTKSAKGVYMPSESLLKLYSEDDLRRKAFFDKVGGLSKTHFEEKNIYTRTFRLAEILLNRAEAYASSNQADKAKKDLETLRMSRYAKGKDVTVSGDVLTAVKEERRKELCFEGLRWVDLKRWGCPAIVHKYERKDGKTEVWTLNEKDPNYTFALPRDVISLNEDIKQHIRKDREPVVETTK